MECGRATAAVAFILHSGTVCEKHFHERSVEPQIRSAALGMTKRRGLLQGEGSRQRRGRLPKERAVAKGEGSRERIGQSAKERAVAKGEGGCRRAFAKGSPRPNNRPVPWQRSSPCNSPPLFVIPSVAEGSAVPRTLPGNVFSQDVTFVFRGKRNAATQRFPLPVLRWSRPSDDSTEDDSVPPGPS